MVAALLMVSSTVTVISATPTSTPVANPTASTDTAGELLDHTSDAPGTNTPEAERTSAVN